MDRHTKKIKRWPFYIFLFPVFFVLHGYTENFHFISPVNVLLLCLMYVIGALVTVALFYFLFKDLQKAALMSFFILTFDYLFGNMLDLFQEISPAGLVTKYSFLIPVFLIMGVVLFFIIKRRKSFFNITHYLNILLIVLLCIDVVLLIKQIPGKNRAMYGNLPPGFIPCNNCPKPDVYIIMLDEYAGTDELKGIFDYDNRTFIESLASKGFKTINNGRGSYNYTPYSTASTLDMEYLDAQKIKTVKKGYRYSLNKIDNNKTVSFFLAHDYLFFNHSRFTIAGQSADIEGSFIPTNTNLITSGTFLSRLEKDVLLSAANKLNFVWYLKKSMNTTLNENNKLYNLTKEIAETKTGPKIIYTHLMMPHYPYYYNESGELRSFDSLRKSSLDNTADYLSYLKYTNKQVIALVDHILSHSPAPPVIALLSDHGYRYYDNKADLNYHFSTFLSVHLPDRNYSLYTDSISNVNFLRILLNSEFNQKLPLLEYKSALVDF